MGWKQFNSSLYRHLIAANIFYQGGSIASDPYRLPSLEAGIFPPRRDFLEATAAPKAASTPFHPPASHTTATTQALMASQIGKKNEIFLYFPAVSEAGSTVTCSVTLGLFL